VNTRQKMHVLLVDAVAKTGAHTGPMDVLEQAVMALVDCIEVLADAVDVLNDRLEMSIRPQLVVAPDPAPVPDYGDVPAQLSDLTKQVRDLTKVVKKLSNQKAQKVEKKKKK
jgi:ubiquinone biosynthesis protein UbiJ